LSEEMQIKEIMLLLFYPARSSSMNVRSIIFNLSHNVCLALIITNRFNSITSWTCAYVITSCIRI